MKKIYLSSLQTLRNEIMYKNNKFKINWKKVKYKNKCIKVVLTWPHESPKTFCRSIHRTPCIFLMLYLNILSMTVLYSVIYSLMWTNSLLTRELRSFCFLKLLNDTTFPYLFHKMLISLNLANLQCERDFIVNVKVKIHIETRKTRKLQSFYFSVKSSGVLKIS